MNYGIKRIIKKKHVKNFVIELVELFGLNLYAILIFDEDNNLIDSECNCTFEDSKMARKMTNKKFKEKLKNLGYF